MSSLKIASEEKKQREHTLVSELSEFNKRARISEDPKKVQESHRMCATRVKEVEKEGGVIGNTFRELDFLGKGRPNDEICKLTGKYARGVLKEESSRDICDVVRTEIVEEKIRTSAERKRRVEKLK
jgi:hypothetical protein